MSINDKLCFISLDEFCSICIFFTALVYDVLVLFSSSSNPCRAAFSVLSSFSTLAKVCERFATYVSRECNLTEMSVALQPSGDQLQRKQREGK